MRVHLPYGRQGLEVELPEQARVLLPERVPALAQPADAVHQALRQPIGSPPLAELARPAHRVAIVFSDITRPTPNHILLPAILAELAARGVAEENVALVNATGMHRPNTREELIAMLGQEVERILFIFLMVICILKVVMKLIWLLQTMMVIPMVRES